MYFEPSAADGGDDSLSSSIQASEASVVREEGEQLQHQRQQRQYNVVGNVVTIWSTPVVNHRWLASH